MCFPLTILQFFGARISTKVNQAEILEALVHGHHRLIVFCYPDAKIAHKMHYKVHFLQQLSRQV